MRKQTLRSSLPVIHRQQFYGHPASLGSLCCLSAKLEGVLLLRHQTCYHSGRDRVEVQNHLAELHTSGALVCLVGLSAR